MRYAPLSPTCTCHTRTNVTNTGLRFEHEQPFGCLMIDVWVQLTELCQFWHCSAGLSENQKVTGAKKLIWTLDVYNSDLFQLYVPHQCGEWNSKEIRQNSPEEWHYLLRNNGVGSISGSGNISGQYIYHSPLNGCCRQQAPFWTSPITVIIIKLNVKNERPRDNSWWYAQTYVCNSKSLLGFSNPNI